MERNAAIDLFWKVHPKLYQWSGGRIGGSIRGFPVLLLITRGCKSGLERTKALMYIAHGDAFVVVASALGQPTHPAWWLNLTADPNAEVVIGGERIRVRAREAEGEELEALWHAFTEKAGDYAKYRALTSRRVPVVVLEPQGLGYR